MLDSQAPSVPKKGEIEVHVTRRTIASAAAWISGQYVPFAAANMTVSIFPDSSAQSRLEGLIALSKQLQKAAVRRRTTTIFTINVCRQIAIEFVLAANFSVIAGVPLPRSVYRASAQFRAATRARRGRKTLIGVELAARSRAEFARDARYRSIDDARHRKRLLRRDRWDSAIDQWFTEVAARGESALTTSVPPPKF